MDKAFTRLFRLAETQRILGSFPQDTPGIVLTAW